MLLIEVVANSMLLILGLLIGFIVLNRLLQRAVELSFAKTARTEASDLDDQLRRLNRER